MVDAAYYQELLRPIFNGRRVVLLGAPLAGSTDLIKRLRSLGAARCLAIASGPGTGSFPNQEDAEWLILQHRAVDVVAELHEIERLMADPPREVLETIERYDPDRQAVILAPVVTLGPTPSEMAGRKVWGRRPPASLVLEDKTRIDAFWDRAGITRAPSVVAPASIDAIIGAHHRMDRGAGTVMAGDAREGLHGGAHLVRWVRSPEDLTRAIELFSGRCDRIRVMPYLEGIPCSIHGVVFADDVVAVRPVEMVTLRPVAGFRFLYAGAATFWDPADGDREYMRSLARRAGMEFRRIAGLGTFTVDGVITDSGFLPTEMNPRFGAGLNVIGRGLPDFPIGLLILALQEGEPLDYRPQDLERLLVSGADAHRSGGGWTVIPKVEEQTRDYGLVRKADGYRLASSGEATDGSLLIGPSSVGGFVRFTPEPARTPVGQSIAPAVVAAFALADREFETGLGPLTAAMEVRR